MRGITASNWVCKQDYPNRPTCPACWAIGKIPMSAASRNTALQSAGKIPRLSPSRLPLPNLVYGILGPQQSMPQITSHTV